MAKSKKQSEQQEQQWPQLGEERVLLVSRDGPEDGWHIWHRGGLGRNQWVGIVDGFHIAVLAGERGPKKFWEVGEMIIGRLVDTTDHWLLYKDITNE